MDFLSVFSLNTQNNLEISDTECDPSGNSNLSFQARADILNLLLLYDLFMFFHI